MNTKPAIDDHADSLPRLMRDRSFWGMTITQFLGAFNDNLYKQLMLLLAVPVGAALLTSAEDQQDVATVVFSLPFVLFSGIAGYLADRYSKSQIIFFSKVAEIAAMGLGMVAFLMYPHTGYAGLMVVLFLMGMQSTFFGPGKYGILPELFRGSDLPRANGIILMTTFLAIIFGTVTAGFLGSQLIDESKPLAVSAPNLWIGSAVCIGIALIGTLTALLIRRVEPAYPRLQLRWYSWLMSPETFRLLRNDRPLVGAILASSVFWMVSGIAVPAVNSLGLVQLGLDHLFTSIMTAMIGLGIAIGGVLAGRMSQGRANPRVARWGLWGITICLMVISVSLPAEGSSAGGEEYRHVLGFSGSLPVLILLGVSAAMFAIPVQVFIQSRPPEDQKGRMIAVMNQANFLAILFSGVIYGLFDAAVEALAWPRSPIFAFMAALVLPVLIFYHPKFE